MIKKIITLLMLVMIVCTGCGKKQKEEQLANDLETIIKRDTLVVGIKTDSYPFGYIDEKGHYAGYDASLGRIIARGILGSDKKVKFVPVTTADRMMKLYSGEVDMLIATMSITSKRQEIIDFSNPYHMAGQAILVKKGSPIKSLRDLSGKTAIIVFGSTSEQSLRNAIPNLRVIGYKTYQDALKALKENKADAIVSDDTILLGMQLKDDSVKLLPKRYTKEPYAVAFRKGADSQSLREYIDTYLEQYARTGRLSKLQQKWSLK